MRGGGAACEVPLRLQGPRAPGPPQSATPLRRLDNRRSESPPFVAALRFLNSDGRIAGRCPPRSAPLSLRCGEWRVGCLAQLCLLGAGKREATWQRRRVANPSATLGPSPQNTQQCRRFAHIMVDVQRKECQQARGQPYASGACEHAMRRGLRVRLRTTRSRTAFKHTHTRSLCAYTFILARTSSNQPATCCPSSRASRPSPAVPPRWHRLALGRPANSSAPPPPPRPRRRCSVRAAALECSPARLPLPTTESRERPARQRALLMRTTARIR